MQHRNFRIQASAGVKRFVLTTAVAAAMVGTAATTTAFTSHTATPATRPAAAAVQLVTASPAARPAAARPAAAKPAAKQESALARAFNKYFRHQAASGMTAWIKTGTEQANEAILMQARGDAYPHRNAALPADSAALAASARHGLAHPSPVDTAGWNWGALDLPDCGSL
jgi:hypothetical protein